MSGAEDNGRCQGLAERARNGLCMSRRRFLMAGASAITVAALGRSGGALAQGEEIYALKASYPRERIAALSELETGVPVMFNYPYENVSNALIRLGAPAGGGIGPDTDVVAFNQVCPHMGGPLYGTYKAEHQVLGPCPYHLSTFDLTRHGMIVSGHATESLPQIMLELDGDDIYAVGVMGLLYGYGSNLARGGA